LDDAADALAASLATGIGRLGVRLGAGEPLVTPVDYRYVPDAADLFVEEPSVEDLTAADILLPEHPGPGRFRKTSS